MALLKEVNLDDDTLVMFSSDNGASTEGGSDPDFFHNTRPLRGHKTELYEGGIRAPLLARWPGRVKAGATSDHVCALWDVMPTLAELAGAPLPAGLKLDGVSYAPTLLGEPGQKPHEYLYWESPARGGAQAVRLGDWKGVRLNVKRNSHAPVQLYNLKDDIGETRDVAAGHGDVVKQIEQIMHTGRTESPVFPLLSR
jgi:arylsulfatase A-like enzyme